MSEYILTVFVSVGVFLLCMFFVRWFLGINRIVDSLQDQVQQNRVQIRLLQMMLLKQGISKEDIEKGIKDGL